MAVLADKIIGALMRYFSPVREEILTSEDDAEHVGQWSQASNIENEAVEPFTHIVRGAHKHATVVVHPQAMECMRSTCYLTSISTGRALHVLVSSSCGQVTFCALRKLHCAGLKFHLRLKCINRVFRHFPLPTLFMNCSRCLRASLYEYLPSRHSVPTKYILKSGFRFGVMFSEWGGGVVGQ